jgi:ABC-type sugar transport system substrate-binding protein
MEDWLQAFPEIDTVFGVAAPLGEGAAITLTQVGRKSKTLVACASLAVKVLNGEAFEVPKMGSLTLPPKILYQLSPAYDATNAAEATGANDWAPAGWSPPR